MASSIDQNQSPYFDDFNAENDYVKILFKADSGAVQSRELNQIQSILQNQIEKFGDNIFQQGTIIEGCNVTLHPFFPYIKINDLETDGTPVNVSSFRNLFVKNSSNLVSYVIDTIDGYETKAPDLNTLYVKYLNSGISGSETAYSANDILTIYDERYTIFGNKVVNGSSKFSNNDTLVFMSAITVSNSSGGTSFAPGTFNVNDVINNGVANAIIVEANTTANTDYMILKLKPAAGDLLTANTLLWKFGPTETIVNLNNSQTAVVKDIIGTGAEASIVTDNLGKILGVNMVNNGQGYYVAPYVTVSITSTGSSVANNDINQLEINAKNYLSNVIVANTAQDPIGSGYAISISDGVIYQKGYFINVSEHLLTVNKYSNTGFSKSVGFYTQEEIINSNQDTSILDNATGAPNYTAPGADRLKMTPSLYTISKDEASANAEFLPIVEFADGVPYKNQKQTVYNVIGDELAKRTYEESGNYSIDLFLTSTTDSSTFSENKDIFKLVVDPGKAYINGNRVETTDYYSANVAKGTDTISNPNATIRVGYGNYILVNELGGVFNFNYGDMVDIYDTAKDFLTNRAASITPTGNKIGTARMRSLLLDSGEPGSPSAIYRLYLFDISIESGKSFSAARAFHYNGTNKGICDVVLEAGSVYLHDSEFNSLLFNSATAVKSVDTITYTYRTQNDNLTANSTGYITIAPPGSNEYFPYAFGTLGTIAERDLVIVSMGNYRATTNVAGSLTSVSGNNTVTGLGTSFVTDFRAGDFITIDSGAANNTLQIASITNNTSFEVTGGATSLTGNAAILFPNNVPVSITSRDTRTVTMESNGQLTINLGTNLANNSTGSSSSGRFCVAYNVTANNVTPTPKSVKREIFTRVVAANNVGGTRGPWSLGVSDAFRLRKVSKKNNGYSNTTVSFNANTNVVSNFVLVTNNPFANNDYVRYNGLTTNITGLANNTSYYVVAANSSGFSLSTSMGGSVISLTPSGTNENHTFNGKTINFGEDTYGVYDATSDFYIDINQREDFLDTSYLFLNPRVAELSANDVLLIEYDAFDSVGAGVRTVTSYPVDDTLTLSQLSNNAINTAEIPEIYATNGGYFDLRDQIDFRPTSANTIAHTANFSSQAIINPTEPSDAARFSSIDHKFPVPDTNLIANVEYYIGRNDRVVVDINGNFTSTKGIPNSNTYPAEPEDSITLAVYKIPPYPSYPFAISNSTREILDTKTANEQIGKRAELYTITQLESRDADTSQTTRYTMRDIQALDRRISDLEYYVSFTLAETIAKMRFIGSSNDPTSDRFKFGFFVDPFEDYSFSDTYNPEFYSTIKDGYLYPKQMDFSLDFEALDGSGIITIPYIETVGASQDDNTNNVKDDDPVIVVPNMNISIQGRKNKSGRASQPYVFDDYYYKFNNYASPAYFYKVSGCEVKSHIPSSWTAAIEISQSTSENGPWTTVYTSAAGVGITDSDRKWLVDNKIHERDTYVDNNPRTGPVGTEPVGGFYSGAYKIVMDHNPNNGLFYRMRVYYQKSHNDGSSPDVLFCLHYPGEEVIKQVPVANTSASKPYVPTPYMTCSGYIVYQPYSSKNSLSKIEALPATIQCYAKNLTPNTVYTFSGLYFDNNPVVKMSGSSSNILKSDSSGNLNFTYYFKPQYKGFYGTTYHDGKGGFVGQHMVSLVSPSGSTGVIGHIDSNIDQYSNLLRG